MPITDAYNPLNYKIAIIGLGYVGLPLAIEFAKKYKVIGFDIRSERLNELLSGFDRTQQADVNELKMVMSPTITDSQKSGLAFSDNVNDIADCNIYIVTVPTPINKLKAPDLTPLLNASRMIGGMLKKGDIVIYESTVYPGCTEDDCMPVLEQYSHLKFNKDFYCGYSPERINPGDKINTLTKIKKVTSGSTPEIADIVDNLYSSIIEAGTYKAPSIKVAEASKAVENAQRDVNISFVNELALIFDRIGIDTNDVIEAASTKWNFLKYKPGLVGGHCIGVDPYYLAHKAESLGYHPQVILSGRNVNDNMGVFVANKTIKLLAQHEHAIADAKVLILGIAFKENCPDIRNTKVADIYHELKEYNITVDIFDPIADPAEVMEEYGIQLLPALHLTGYYNAVIIAVAHDVFLSIDFGKLKSEKTLVFDTKACIDKRWVDARL